MDRFAGLVVRYRKAILIFFVVATALSVLLALGVEVNYDLTQYLPQDSITTKAMDKLESEFGYPEIGTVMVRDISIPGALAIKGDIEAIDGVSQVLWLDDIADITQPIEFLDPNMTESYYKDGNALFQVTYFENGYSPVTADAIDSIRAMLTEKVGEERFALGGPQVASKALVETTEREVLVISAVAVVIVLIILLLLTDSWLAPFLYLISIGVAVLINMGSNIFVGRISNVTQSTQAILQMAISMDYSIFLFERFMFERENGASVTEAVKTAVKKSVVSLSGSSLTTIAGFLALWFMDYGIGFDLGRVLVKGIVISLFTIMTLLPVLILFTAPLLEKLRHRSLMPGLEGFARTVLKGRYIFIVLCFLVMVPAFLAQSRNDFLYGEAGINKEGTEIFDEGKEITDIFGEQNQVVLLVPKGSVASETALADDLGDKEYVKSLQSIPTLADPAIPREILPGELTDNFASDEYVRMIIMLDVPSESEETFAAVEDLKNTISGYYDEYYLAGSSTAIYDIKQVVETDYNTVNTISILSVMFIILIVFRSLSLPFILTFVIEISIWINMSIPYFAGNTLSFVGYLIVSSVQLGATIDYAILLADRYLEYREILPKRDAAMKAVSTSGGSVFTSFLILGTAGLSLGIVSQTAAISELGTLIGRGAFMSGVMVLILLPQLLVIFDPVIMRTTLRGRKKKGKVL
ncbi:MAG: MMPL family transporter [Clostridiales bacterium]|nr:MMPL family transporter [Clostridiales bacterium]